MPHFKHSITSGVLGFVAMVPAVSAQCANGWVSTGGLPGVNGVVYASTMFDPDGPGPAPAQLVVGGEFSAAGNVPAANIAAWDTATGVWSPLGAGIVGGVKSLTILPNGDLVAGGTTRVSRWNGATWQPLGGVFVDSLYASPAINALAVLPNGDLVAAGWFSSAGGTPASHIARWDGTSWSALGSGLNAFVRALTTLANGDLVAGGLFTNAGGVPADRVARWNGATWSALGTGIGNSVYSLASLPNGDLLAGWNVNNGASPPTSFVWRWNGTSWSQLGTTMLAGTMNALTVLANGDVLAAGDSVVGAIPGFCQRWNGSSWSPLGPGPLGVVHAVTQLPNAQVVVCGNFAYVAGVQASGVAKWSGTAWQSLGVPGMTGLGWALAALPNGDLVAGGNAVVRWNGTGWTQLGGVFGANGVHRVTALAALPGGDLVAGGYFLSAGGVPANCIARWDGTAWLPMGSGMFGNVRALAVLPDGSLVAGGDFVLAGAASGASIARWDGTAWSSFAGGVSFGGASAGDVSALAVAPNGDLFVAGSFDRAGSVSANNIARWNGSTWSALGSGAGGVVGSLAIPPDGSLIAGGLFVSAGGVVVNSIARWNGAAWSGLGGGVTSGGFAGSVARLLALPNGDVLATGAFTAAGGTPVNGMARWNGTGWSSIGTGADGFVYSLAFRPTGEVFVGGDFSFVSGVLSPGIARLTTPCPATATPNGTGCTGSGGANVLTATSLPWIGATSTAVATGMPTGSLAIVVTGLAATSTPLAAILAQGTPGCSLLASPDLLTAALTGTGTVPVALTLPDSASLVGLSLHQQVVALEIVAGNFVAATSTNALVLQCGAF